MLRRPIMVLCFSSKIKEKGIKRRLEGSQKAFKILRGDKKHVQEQGDKVSKE